MPLVLELCRLLFEMRYVSSDTSYNQNLIIEELPLPTVDDPLFDLGEELERVHADVVVTWGERATQAARYATRRSPVVFVVAGDPVAMLLVADLARPGGNITGLGGAGILNAKRLALLKEALPRATRVAILWNPGNPSHEAVLKDLEGTARSLGIQLHPVRVSRSGELESAFSAITYEHAGALFVFGDAMFFGERSESWPSRRRAACRQCTRGARP